MELHAQCAISPGVSPYLKRNEMHHYTDCRKGYGDKDLENRPHKRSPQSVFRVPRHQLCIIEAEKLEVPLIESKCGQKRLDRRGCGESLLRPSQLVGLLHPVGHIHFVSQALIWPTHQDVCQA